MAHTPGPWEIEREWTDEEFPREYMAWIVAPSKQIERYPKLYPGETDPARIADLADADDCTEADAQLIAAAPDLLEALKGIIAVADRKTDEFDRAKAAIAKATGQPAPAESPSSSAP